MNFIVSSTDLLKSLQMLNGVVNTNNTLPILDNFLFETADDLLTVTASDLETTIVTRLSIKNITHDPAKLCVPAKLIVETLKTFPEQPLTIKAKFDQNIFEINSDQGSYNFAMERADEFPQIPELNQLSQLNLPDSMLNEAITKTLFAAGNDELRPTITGVLFQLETDKCTFVSTDSHRLVRYTRHDITASDKANFIVPRKPLTLLKSILSHTQEEVLVEYNEMNARFTFGDTTLICRLIDGKYPNYESVIPTENPNVLTINRGLFQNAIKRVSIFSNKTTHQIRLSLAGTQLHLSAEDLDFSNKAEERLSCDYSGDDIFIGFNSRFLSDMLANLVCDDITLEMSEPNRAGIIKPIDGLEDGEEILMLVMPIMLNAN